MCNNDLKFKETNTLETFNILVYLLVTKLYNLSIYTYFKVSGRMWVQPHNHSDQHQHAYTLVNVYVDLVVFTRIAGTS